MTSTLEGQVAELVSAIIRQTEARVEQAFSQAIDRELAARRNGDALDVVEMPSTKQCTRCGELKPLSDYPPERKTRDGRRTICRTCKSRRDRERRAQRRERESVDEPHPARPRREHGYNLVARSDVDDAAVRREQLAELRLNGVEYVERDGQTFTVLRLPAFEHDGRRAQPPPVRPRHARGFALA